MRLFNLDWRLLWTKRVIFAVEFTYHVQMAKRFDVLAGWARS